MEFRLDEGQVELQRTVARFCEDRFALDAIEGREGAPLDRSRWAQMAELGIFGLVAAEDLGGSALGAVSGALVFEQLGSHLVPGPVHWTVVAADLVDGAASGALAIGGVDARAVHDGDAVVEHAADLDAVLVVGEGEVALHRTAALAPPVPLQPLDPGTPVGRFHGLGGGEVVGGPAEAGRARSLGATLAAAALAGIAARSLEVARAYALEREQFDAPIGSFQAVKHLLADMYVRSTLAQSAAYAAAAVLDDPGDDDPQQAAGTAKVLAGDAAIANASAAVQVLGGMGFTWDMLPHHLLKRAWVLEQSFGTADDHATARGARIVAEAT